MKENMQYVLLGAVLLCAYFAFRLNKQAQENNTTIFDILKENKEIVLITGVSVLGLIYFMNRNEDGVGINLFGQDKLCNSEFYEQP